MRYVAIVVGLFFSTTMAIGQISVEYTTVAAQKNGAEIETKTTTNTTVIDDDGTQYTIRGDGGPGLAVRMPEAMEKARIETPPGNPMVDIDDVRSIAGLDGCTGKTGPGPTYMHGERGPEATLEVWFCVEPETQITFMAEYKLVFADSSTIRTEATRVTVLREEP